MLTRGRAPQFGCMPLSLAEDHGHVEIMEFFMAKRAAAEEAAQHKVILDKALVS